MRQPKKTKIKANDLQALINEGFWGGNLPVARWSAAIKDPMRASRFIIKTSFDYMPSKVLIHEMGEKQFIKAWPAIRSLFDQQNQQDLKRLKIFDCSWGILAAGDSQYPVSQKVANLSKGQRALLSEVVTWPGISIYALHKRAEREYSRVFKEVKLLVEQQLIEIRKAVQSGRVVSCLFAAESINTKLFEMERLRREQSAAREGRPVQS